MAKANVLSGNNTIGAGAITAKPSGSVDERVDRNLRLADLSLHRKAGMFR
jgi:hypothetical protein